MGRLPGVGTGRDFCARTMGADCEEEGPEGTVPAEAEGRDPDKEELAGPTAWVTCVAFVGVCGDNALAPPTLSQTSNLLLFKA